MKDYQVLYESANFLVINKAARVHHDEILTQGDTDKHFPVHRIDYESSGALLFTKQELVEKTRALFKQIGPVTKTYLAGASKKIELESTDWLRVKGFVGGRYRSSKKVKYFLEEPLILLPESHLRKHMSPEKRPQDWHGYQAVEHLIRPAQNPEAHKIFHGELYEIQLLSGARHQIRSFFAAVGCPLVGDPLYGEETTSEKKENFRLELHAWKLEFTSPLNDGETVSAVAPL